MGSIEKVRDQLGAGLVIPACPLALTSRRKLSERHQRALVRYYSAAGAGGLAVGVHTTQFAIRDPKIGLYQPVLELVRETAQNNQLGSAKHKGSGRRNNSSDATRRGPDSATDIFRVNATRPRARRLGGKFASQELALPKAHQKGQGNVINSEERKFLLVAGVCGQTRQAVAEATLARALGYDCGLLSLGALREATDGDLVQHCRAVAQILPLFGFYLQPSAGGRPLGLSFWRRFVEIPEVVAIKIAPFNRYQTLDVIRAVVEAGRDDIALYTGNDDNIVLDLLSPFRFVVNGQPKERHIIGGLLGHWAVWTRRAVELHAACRRLAKSGRPISSGWLRLALEVTDANSALFDPAHQFAGCIPGIHEVLRRQGLLPGTQCLDPKERLSAGQRGEIERVIRDYPHLTDDDFVAEHRDDWLR